MKTTQKKEVKKSWALSGESLTASEFKKGIKEAEQGPFYSIEETKKMLSQWKKQNNFK